MARIENFRKGDRAEKLGVFLLQSFCAVAEIPRQEDFGLMDVVATLLRRDGRFFHAEDSFLVQIKSRTERKVEYFDSKFEALLSQDLPLLIAQVDLTQASVELHTLGTGLAHANINDAKGLVAFLHPAESCTFGLVDDVLHLPLKKPILRWTAADTENLDFTNKAYAILKKLFAVERWNRRYRLAGMSRQFLWETNEMPTEGAQVQTWNPKRTGDALGEIASAVKLLPLHAIRNPMLRAPTRAILTWLCENGIEADPNGIHRLILQRLDSQDLLKIALAHNPEADVALTFYVIEARPDYLDFWQFSRSKDGIGAGHRYFGSLETIHDQGLEATVEIVGEVARIAIGPTAYWLAQNHLAEANRSKSDASSQNQDTSNVLLLRRTL